MVTRALDNLADLKGGEELGRVSVDLIVFIVPETK